MSERSERIPGRASASEPHGDGVRGRSLRGNMRERSEPIGFRHDIRIRYGEVDMQGVVFNAHYLAYVDDCIDSWLRSIDAHFEKFGWDIMVKKATVEWLGAAGIGDVLTLVPRVSRWGRTSFDVTVDGATGERPVFEATVVYVGVETGTLTPAPVPDEIRAALSA